MLADHYLDLYRMAFVLLQNEADVEDVVQEALAVTMSKTWVKDPYKYCLQVLYNQCYKMVKGKEYVLVENMPETVEQDDDVAGWSDATIDKIKQVLNKVLIENEYIDGPRATKLNPVMICTEVENAIRANGDEVVLPAFNCFY